MTEVISNFNDAGHQWAWDSTSVGYIQACPRKYYYKIICGWQPAQKSVHLLFGGLYATALEHYFLFRAEGDDEETALIRTVHEALINSWDSEKGKPKEFIHAQKTRESLIRSIVWYFAEYANDTTTPIILASGKPAVEHSFKIDIGDNMFYCGHLDRGVMYQDHPYVMDQKTTGFQLTPYYYDQFETSFQMSGYSFAGKLILDMPVRGVIIDAAKISTGATEFGRSTTLRTESQLNEWLDDAHYWMNFANRCNEEERYPMNTASCGNYGGCEFKGVCGRAPAVRENFLRADFNKEKPWNPLESR